MLEQNSVQYPHFSQFIQILLFTPPNTSPVERGYAYLQMASKVKKPFMLRKHWNTIYVGIFKIAK